MTHRLRPHRATSRLDLDHRLRLGAAHASRGWISTRCTRALSAVTCAIVFVSQLTATGAEEFARLAPYPAIRWQGDVPEVRIAGEWWVLTAIDARPVDAIVGFAKGRYAGRWQKRFDEDLVQVLSEMGHPPRSTVALALRDAAGAERTLENVPMTEENRRAILEFKYSEERAPEPPVEASVETLLHAIDEFERAVDERWAYRHGRRFEYADALRDLRSMVSAGQLATAEVGIELQKIIAEGIDGHAGIIGFDLPPGGCLPFLIEPVGRRFVAIRPDRSGFLEPGFPYIATIDGKSLSIWCAAAAAFVPKGSAQYQRMHALRLLREIDYFRGLLHLPKSKTLAITLLGTDERTTKTIEFPVADRPARYGTWPRTESRLLADNIGYLRLSTMDAASSVREIREWLPRFRETAGLVIDVRDNGGGDREALRWLYSYLVEPAAAPRVVNVAAYRLHPAHPEDHLAARHMHRGDAAGLTDPQRAAIASFDERFKPLLRGGHRPLADALKTDFSPRHYLILERLDDPDLFHYPKPVVVLMNAKCFSATDVFLAGLGELPNVTLLGTASSGGSARVQLVRLGKTPFTLRIGSMVSFQPNGRLFDGFGVMPDIEVEPVPEYFTGGHDNVLDRAIQHLVAK